MKKSINLLICLLFVLMFIPFVVEAGGSNDDVTYELKTKLDENYEYGNVKKCRNIGGIAYWIGIKKVSNLSVCLWREGYDNGLSEFSCEDSEMEQFSLEAKAGGETIYGAGCRKHKKK